MSSKNLGPVFYAGEKRNVRRHDVKMCLACALALCIDNFRLKKYIFGRCSLSLDSSYPPALRNIAIDGKASIISFIFASSKKASDVISQNINDVGHRKNEMSIGMMLKHALLALWLYASIIFD